jgi:predicted O-methyltransferase YrrM
MGLDTHPRSLTYRAIATRPPSPLVQHCLVRYVNFDRTEPIRWLVSTGAYCTGPALVCETSFMDEELWSKVDQYLVSLLLLADDALDEALAASDEAGLPKINVAPNQGKLLTLLARMSGASRILEIGTLGGYSTICLGRSLPANGALVSLELDPHHAQVARANLDEAGLGPLVKVRVGPANASLRQMVEDGADPFDFIFIDADKEGYPEYLELSLLLSRVGTVIVADNVVRSGEVANFESTDPRVLGVRTFLERAAADGRLDGTAVQTVGSKGYDGFSLFVVTGT